MNFPCYSSIISILLFLAMIDIHVPYTTASIKLPPNVTIPAIFVFGDSLVDTGNNNFITTSVKGNFRPYGKFFKGGFSTGRFCDGKVPSDLIAEELGIKDTVPAYLDPTILPEDLLTGVAFASGGSGYDPLTPALVSVISLDNQLEHFKEYIRKVKGLVGEKKAKFIIANSLYLVVAGSDDIANTYFTRHARKLGYNINSYSNLMVNSATRFVRNLHKMGARRIGVLSAPPIGCVPAQRTIGGGIHRECAESQNRAAVSFNYKLSKMLSSLNSKLSNSKIIFVDVYDSFLDIIQRPRQYGFEIANRGCCGTENGGTAMLCNRESRNLCSNVSNYVFWDGYHPTEKAYRVLTSHFTTNYINKFF